MPGSILSTYRCFRCRIIHCGSSCHSGSRGAPIKVAIGETAETREWTPPRARQGTDTVATPPPERRDVTPLREMRASPERGRGRETSQFPIFLRLFLSRLRERGCKSREKPLRRDDARQAPFPFLGEDDVQMCLKQGPRGSRHTENEHRLSSIFIDLDKAITIDIRSDLLSPPSLCARKIIDRDPCSSRKWKRNEPFHLPPSGGREGRRVEGREGDGT